IEELLARIRAALRKHSTVTREDDTIELCGVKLSPKRREVTANGTPVELSKREFDLLEYLMRNKGIVLTRDQLLDNVWDFDFDGGTNTVDVYVRFLRQKIDDVLGIKLISTVRGVGYVIRGD
ncbi:MAG: response regulator transcription factor, partial [Oscillospiraceae bacterium]|nr:response regulator transcription factor [Oscillospiraceae bacterium]